MKSPYFLSYIDKQYKDDKANLDEKKRELLENYKLAVEANKRDEEAIKEMDPIEYEYKYSGINYISSEEMHEKKIEIMLEALFLKHFTPIDMKTLEKDWTLLRSLQPGENTPETIETQKRFHSTACSAYYKEIKPDTANEKIIEEIVEKTVKKYITKTSVREE